MTYVSQVLQEKRNAAIYQISPEATVLEAITLMADKSIGALVVTHEGHVVGIFSERDYTRKVALMERTSTDTLVSEIMTPRVITVTSHNTVKECLELMTERHLRHLPVVDHNQLIGMISIGDLVKAVMDDQRKLINQLQTYIAS